MLPWVSVRMKGAQYSPRRTSVLMAAHTVLCAVCAGRHHDNYTIKHTRARLQGLAGPEGSTHAGQENSQRIGSEVLLYT